MELAAVEYEEREQNFIATVMRTVDLPATAVTPPSGRHAPAAGVVLVPPELADRLPLEVRTTAAGHRRTRRPGDPRAGGGVREA